MVGFELRGVVDRWFPRRGRPPPSAAATPTSGKPAPASALARPIDRMTPVSVPPSTTAAPASSTAATTARRSTASSVATSSSFMPPAPPTRTSTGRPVSSFSCSSPGAMFADLVDADERREPVATPLPDHAATPTGPDPCTGTGRPPYPGSVPPGRSRRGGGRGGGRRIRCRRLLPARVGRHDPGGRDHRPVDRPGDPDLSTDRELLGRRQGPCGVPNAVCGFAVSGEAAVRTGGDGPGRAVLRRDRSPGCRASRRGRTPAAPGSETADGLAEDSDGPVPHPAARTAVVASAPARTGVAWSSRSSARVRGTSGNASASCNESRTPSEPGADDRCRS